VSFVECVYVRQVAKNAGALQLFKLKTRITIDKNGSPKISSSEKN